ncbi:C-type lectin 1-like, partial [Python bivittatus]|uniref:C-type lectin 1-like n=1 Tax=Python bivittatus TaxID=176946 RepID=A0A9F3QTR4_PYTBI
IARRGRTGRIAPYPGGRAAGECVSVEIRGAEAEEAVEIKGTGAPNYCPFSWLTYNDSSNKIFKKFKTWNDAEMFCVDQETGCHLASIHVAAEMLQLAQYVSQHLSIINV